MGNKLAKGFGVGSKPSTGNISDNKLKSYIPIPSGTLVAWKKTDEDSYRRAIYKFLKVINEDEYKEFMKRIDEFDNL